MMKCKMKSFCEIQKVRNAVQPIWTTRVPAVILRNTHDVIYSSDAFKFKSPCHPSLRLKIVIAVMRTIAFNSMKKLMIDHEVCRRGVHMLPRGPAKPSVCPTYRVEGMMPVVEPRDMNASVIHKAAWI